MNQPPPSIIGFPAILFVLAVAMLLAGALILVSKLLGPKNPTAEKNLPYESGMTPIGSTHQQFGVHYYVVAMLFILFDVDVIFMYPWAILLRRELGRFGLVEMGIFVATIVVAYVYIVKKGALEWD